MSAVIPTSSSNPPGGRPGNGPGGAKARLAVPRAVMHFWDWWTDELRRLFGPLLEKYWVDRADTLDIRLSADGEVAYPPRLSGRDVRIVVDWAHVLQKTVSYPAAVEENLAMVLAADLDRQTPFTADQIYLTHRVERRYESADGVARIDVELTMVLRRDVLPTMAHVRASGAAVYSVVITNPADRTSSELLPINERALRRLSRLQKTNIGLLGLLILLIAAAIAAPILQRRAEVLELAPLVEKARSEADATRKIESEFQRLSQEYQVATTKKYQTFPVIDIVEELTRLSPDTTWLQSVEMKSPPGSGKAKNNIREVQLIGEAASASKMIEALEQSPLLQNTTQRAQTTRGSQPNTERFQIATELKPRVLPELVDLAADAQPSVTAPVSNTVGSSAPLPAGSSSPSAASPLPVPPPSTQTSTAPVRPANRTPATATSTAPPATSATGLPAPVPPAKPAAEKIELPEAANGGKPASLSPGPTRVKVMQ